MHVRTCTSCVMNYHDASLNCKQNSQRSLCDIAMKSVLKSDLTTVNSRYLDFGYLE